MNMDQGVRIPTIYMGFTEHGVRLIDSHPIMSLKAWRHPACAFYDKVYDLKGQHMEHAELLLKRLAHRAGHPQ